MGEKEKLKQEIWNKDVYYRLARAASLKNHPGMVILYKLADGAKKILDLGCGEGTRLNLLKSSNRRLVGVDISQKAISLASKSYPSINFLVADLEKLPFKNDSFDLVYSAFVLEHLDNPTLVLNEAIRVLSPGGKLLLLAPNYGSPNRASPLFKGSRINKLIKGCFDDLRQLFKKNSQILWNKVKPMESDKEYQVDWDTTMEPYLGSLRSFLSFQGLKILLISSCWTEELQEANLSQKILRYLGELRIYPFWLWGPHILLVAQK